MRIETNNHNLSKRTFHASLWSLCFQFLSKFLHVLLGIILVRVLEPGDYGLLGMLTIFWSISSIFISGGFGSALIQRKEITEIDLSTVFYYNLTLGLLCCFGMIASASYIAEFYHQPILEQMIYVTAWTLPISALTAMQRIQLEKNLKQNVISLIGFINFIFSGTLALYLAWRGYGVWALVWQSFFNTCCNSILLFSVVHWIPKIVFSIRSFCEMFRFGSNILLAAFISNIIENLYGVFIGRFYKVEALGYFEKSRGYAFLLPTSIQDTLSSVLFPAFSMIQNDDERLRNAFSRAIAICSYVIFFPVFLFCTLSEPFVKIILTDKWLPIIPYLWLFSFCSVFYPFVVMNHQLLLARGRSGNYFFLVIITRLLSLVNLVITFRFGTVYIVIGMLLVSVCAYILSALVVSRNLCFSVMLQLRCIVPSLLLTLVSCIITVTSYYILRSFNMTVAACIALLAGCYSYILLSGRFKTKAFQYLLGMVEDRFPKIGLFLLALRIIPSKTHI